MLQEERGDDGVNHDRLQREVDRFDPTVPIERASTPPASWYTDAEFHELERRTVFRRSWQAVARLDQLTRPGDYTCGEIVGEPYVVLRDRDGELRAFFNVCRHHASCVAQGDGNTEQLVCPYHGWTYDLDGRLRKAPRLGGAQDFDRDRFGLRPIEVAVRDPLVFIRFEGDAEPLDRLLEPLAGKLRTKRLKFIRRVTYELACNWKVFVDNYLDGGYHVAYLHRGLAAQLDLDSYRTVIDGKISLQLCGSQLGQGPQDETGGVDFKDRLGGSAMYAFVYPNLMINRYGPFMDTNWVVPLAHDRTLTVFDYFLEGDRVEGEADFVERSLVASDRVQQEDIGVCESVQRGLASSAYDRGRYAPGVEQAAHQFHVLLAAELKAAETS